MTYPATTTHASTGEPIRMTITERRATYPLQEKIKIYNPDTMARRLSQMEKQPTKLVVHGVNILNKTSIDSETAMSRIKQRRETHNRVERRRRDNLNLLVNELSDLVPKSCIEKNGGEKCHRAKVLRYAIEYIKTIKDENALLREQLGIASPEEEHCNYSPQLSPSSSVEEYSDTSPIST